MAIQDSASTLERALSSSLSQPDAIIETIPIIFTLAGVAKFLTCQAGQFANGASCQNCTSGFYSTSGAACIPCPLNKYQSLPGQSQCKDCPTLKFTTSTGAISETSCIQKCSEANSGQNYCNGNGQCVYDQYGPDGVSCVCTTNYEGSDCNTRKSADTTDKTPMIAGIIGGCAAFLLIVLLIVGIVICLRRKTRRSKKDMYANGNKQYKDTTRFEGSTMSEGYVDYFNPTYDGTSMMRPMAMGNPAVMFIDPSAAAAEQVHRDFYSHDKKSSLSHSRPHSRTYENEWRDMPSL